MRHTLILLALTCAPAFCQGDSPNIQFHYNPQWFPKINVLKARPVFKLQISNNVPLCSIPLLIAKAAGNPVHMPELRIPQDTSDRIAVKPPAPACPAR